MTEGQQRFENPSIAMTEGRQRFTYPSPFLKIIKLSFAF